MPVIPKWAHSLLSLTCVTRVTEWDVLLILWLIITLQLKVTFWMLIKNGTFETVPFLVWCEDIELPRLMKVEQPGLSLTRLEGRGEPACCPAAGCRAPVPPSAVPGQSIVIKHIKQILYTYIYIYIHIYVYINTCVFKFAGEKREKQNKMEKCHSCFCCISIFIKRWLKSVSK